MSDLPDNEPDRDQPPSIGGTVDLADGHEMVLAGLSDVGCVRSNNEDAHGFFVDRDAPHRCLLVVCDGMGGASAGEVASTMALAALRERFLGPEAGGSPRDSRGDSRSDGPGDPPDRDPHDSTGAIVDAIEHANREIHKRSQQDFMLAGMGTTCTAALLDHLDLTVGHVGDSRAYHVRDGAIVQLTRDHSLAEAMRQRGDSDEQETRAARNILTRCLGTAPEVKVDVFREPPALREGDVLVLCSDGLSNPVGPGEILDAVSTRPPEEACRRLVNQARERGGPDNITVIVARIQRANGRPDQG